MLMPCTTTRFSLIITLMTSPRLPLSWMRPLMTSTVSPLRIFTLIPILLQHFRSQRHDLHELLIAQFACHRPKDTRALRVLTVRIQKHSGIIIKADVRTIFASPFFRQANDDRMDHLALFNSTLWRSGLDTCHDYITDVPVPARRAAHHVNDKQFTRSAIICNFQPRLMLDHDLCLRLGISYYISACNGLDACISSAGLALDNRLNNPALITGQRAGLNNLDLIPNLTTDLIVSLDSFAGIHDLFIKRMAKLANNFHYNGLGHFVAGDLPSDSTTIVHALPSVTAEPAISWRTLSMRATSRRNIRMRLVSVN